MLVIQSKELSYVDLLEGIRQDVEYDIIPDSEKAEIQALIQQLQLKLWQYSA